MELSLQHVAEILAALNEPRPTAVGAEQRRSPRGEQRGAEQRGAVLVTPWPEVSGADPKAAPAYSVTVRNCSPHGIAILHGRALQRGEQFVVRLLHHGRETAALLCTVAHCRRVNAMFHVIGAEFTRVLREGETQHVGSGAACEAISA